MNILLVAYSFPPLQEAQSFRWYHLSEAMADKGVKIDVVTIQYPSVNDREWHFNENITIDRLPPGIIESLTLRAKSSLRVDASDNKELRTTKKFRVLKQLNKGFRRAVNSFIPGDTRTDWFLSAARYLNKKVRAKKYDFMITSHEPWVDSLLGLYVKSRNTDLKWVADFGDPYVAPYTPRHKLLIENALEERIYKNADALIFTNASVIDHLTYKYPFLKDKNIMTIEQGFSHKFCSSLERKKEKNSRFTMLYAGTFYKDFRNPTNLIKALSMLDFDYKFVMAGRSEEFLIDFSVLGDKFKFLGFVDHFDILKVESESDLLIHLSNKSEIQIPGKVYEYFGAARPVLCIYYSPDDHAAKVIKEFDRGVSTDNSPEAIKDAITKMYDEWRAGTAREYDNEHIYELSYENKAELILKNLRNI